MGILLNIVLVIFVLVSLLMILVILMQRPKSEGLGAAFGGGVTENIFGAQTTNVLTKFTGWLAGLFFALTFLLSILYARHTSRSSDLRRELMKTEAATGAVPAASPVVGAPNSVTNPTPGADQPAAVLADPPTPADQAVGITAPSASLEAPVPPPSESAPAASAQPSP